MIDTKSLIEELDKATINEDLISEVEGKYQQTFPEQLKKIVSLSETPQFSEEWRTLSFVEIACPEEQLKYDFKHINQLPVIDAFDNNYIVYDFNDSCWKIKNLPDDVDFDKSEKLEDLLK